MAVNPCECDFEADDPRDLDEETGKRGIKYNFYSSSTGEDNLFLDESNSQELCIVDPLSSNGSGKKQQIICAKHKKTEKRFVEIELGDIKLTGTVPNCNEIRDPIVDISYGGGEVAGGKWTQNLNAGSRGDCGQHFKNMGAFNKFTVRDLPECILPHKNTMVDIVASVYNPCSGGGTLRLVTQQNIVCNSGTATVYAIAKGIKGDVQSGSFSSCYRAGVPKGTQVASRKLKCFPSTPPDIKKARIIKDDKCSKINNCCSPQEVEKLPLLYRYCGATEAEKLLDAAAVYCQGRLTYGKGYCKPYEPYVKIKDDGQHITWGGSASNSYFHSDTTGLMNYPQSIADLKKICSAKGPFEDYLFFKEFPKNRPPGTPCVPNADRRSLITAVHKIPKLVHNRLKSAISQRNSDLATNIAKAKAQAIEKYNAQFPNCPFTDIEIHLSTFEAPSVTVGAFVSYSNAQKCAE